MHIVLDHRNNPVPFSPDKEIGKTDGEAHTSGYQGQLTPDPLHNLPPEQVNSRQYQFAFTVHVIIWHVPVHEIIRAIEYCKPIPGIEL